MKRIPLPSEYFSVILSADEIVVCQTHDEYLKFWNFEKKIKSPLLSSEKFGIIPPSTTNGTTPYENQT